MLKASFITIFMLIQFSKCDILTFCADKYEHFYPYADDCSKYIECANHYTYIKDCPGGTYWNQTLGQCDHTCDQEYPTSGASQTPTATSSTQQTETHSTNFYSTVSSTVSPESTSQLTENTAQSTESTAQPTESTSQLTGNTAQPDESTAQPTELISQQTETTSQPAETPTQPIQTTTQPEETTTQQMETTSQHSETTTQPVESITQSENETCNYESVFTVDLNERTCEIIMDNITVISTLECIHNCFQQHNCNFINYRKTDFLCELLHCSASTQTQMSATEIISIALTDY